LRDLIADTIIQTADLIALVAKCGIST
jgi:hypothetical protein